MEATCRRAVQIGLPSIAFTDHADFVDDVHADLQPFDVNAYLSEVERCRYLFPTLRILSGVELGDPHRLPAEAAAVLAVGGLERVLGSVHCFVWNGRIMDASGLRELPVSQAPGAFRSYLRESVALAESGQPFEVMAHLD